MGEILRHRKRSRAPARCTLQLFYHLLFLFELSLCPVALCCILIPHSTLKLPFCASSQNSAVDITSRGLCSSSTAIAEQVACIRHVTCSMLLDVPLTSLIEGQRLQLIRFCIKVLLRAGKQGPIRSDTRMGSPESRHAIHQSVSLIATCIPELISQ